MQQKIDFILTWVDGADPAWQEQRNRYDTRRKSSNVSAQYRDPGTLRYWFRAVEQYAPWVNTVHFVTCGQTPAWLDTDHPKLHLVSHKDYMPEAYLPTFSSHPIELNFHRMEGLAEQFVYFNDDTLLNAPVKQEDFFQKGLPCDSAAFAALIPSVKNELITYALFNNLLLINANFNKRACLKKHALKWFSPKYGRSNLKNLYYLPIGKFSGFVNPHLPNAYLKSTFREAWEAEGEYLDMVSRNRFRTKEDVNQYLMRYWRLVKGEFVPRSDNIGACYVLGEDNALIEQQLMSKKLKMICINDNPQLQSIEEQEAWLIRAFERKFPQKSSFEKQEKDT